MVTENEKIQLIINWLRANGGACQFHFVENICLSVEDDILYEVVDCKKSKENIFGIKNVPFTKMHLLDLIIKEIKLPHEI